MWTNKRTIFNFYDTFTNSIPKWTTFVKEVYDSMISLEVSKWLNDSLTFTFYDTLSNSIPTTSVKKVFDSMISLESDCFGVLNFYLYETFWNCMQNRTTFEKEGFDLMISLQSDKMIIFWPYDSLTFTFHETFSNSISK